MYSPLTHIACKNYSDSEILLTSSDGNLKFLFRFEIRRDQLMGGSIAFHEQFGFVDRVEFDEPYSSKNDLHLRQVSAKNQMLACRYIQYKIIKKCNFWSKTEAGQSTVAGEMAFNMATCFRSNKK
jgi:hypothetical protein